VGNGARCPSGQCPRLIHRHGKEGKVKATGADASEPGALGLGMRGVVWRGGLHRGLVGPAEKVGEKRATALFFLFSIVILRARYSEGELLARHQVNASQLEEFEENARLSFGAYIMRPTSKLEVSVPKSLNNVVNNTKRYASLRYIL